MSASSSGLSSPAEPVRKSARKALRRATTQSAISISDDEGKDTFTIKGKDKGKNECKAEAEPSQKEKPESPKCVADHGAECQGLMPSCQNKKVKDLEAWREFVEESTQARNMWEDTQVDESQGPAEPF